MGFPEPFLRWIEILYSTPTARLRINGHMSTPFTIGRGTRQGCPLSPILFTLILEPLASKIRQRHSEAALQFHLRPLIISLYADDMVLFTRQPQVFLNKLIREYIRFEQYSGLSINWDKSVIIPLTPATKQPTLDYLLKWSMDPVKYLGIWIHRDPELVIRENYGRAMTSLDEQIERWIRMPLSLADRIALQKMIMVPTFLYLFINIPIWITQALFSKLRTAMQRLTWAGKQARISWRILTQPYHKGGFGAPDLQLYYYCAQAQHAHYWYQPHAYVPHVAVERDSVHPVPMSAYIADPKSYIHKDNIQTVQCTSRAWFELAHRANKLPPYAPALPHHPKISVTQEPKLVQLLKDMRLINMSDVFPWGSFLQRDDPSMCAFNKPMQVFAHMRLQAAMKALFIIPRGSPEISSATGITDST